MIKVELTNANNGIIKKVIDSQYNGVDQTVEIITVYELDEDVPFEHFLKVSNIFEDISADLGINLGGEYDEHKIDFDLDWGSKFQPSTDEINKRIKFYRKKIKELIELKKSYD